MGMGFARSHSRSLCATVAAACFLAAGMGARAQVVAVDLEACDSRPSLRLEWEASLQVAERYTRLASFGRLGPDGIIVTASSFDAPPSPEQPSGLCDDCDTRPWIAAISASGEIAWSHQLLDNAEPGRLIRSGRYVLWSARVRSRETRNAWNRYSGLQFRLLNGAGQVAGGGEIDGLSGVPIALDQGDSFLMIGAPEGRLLDIRATTVLSVDARTGVTRELPTDNLRNYMLRVRDAMAIPGPGLLLGAAGRPAKSVRGGAFAYDVPIELNLFDWNGNALGTASFTIAATATAPPDGRFIPKGPTVAHFHRFTNNAIGIHIGMVTDAPPQIHDNFLVIDTEKGLRLHARVNSATTDILVSRQYQSAGFSLQGGAVYRSGGKRPPDGPVRLRLVKVVQAKKRYGIAVHCLRGPPEHFAEPAGIVPLIGGGLYVINADPVGARPIRVARYAFE